MPLSATVLARLRSGAPECSLVGAELRVTDAHELCSELARTASLAVQLDLSANELRSAGAAALAPVLETCTALRSLSLADNVLLDRFLADNGRAEPGETAECTGLHTLLLSACRLSTLEVLNLSYNHLGEEGAACLASVLSLSGGELGGLSLVLGFSKLKAAHVGVLVSSLRRPRGSPLALRALDLRNNTLRLAGAEALAPSLRLGEDGCAAAVGKLGLMNNFLRPEGMDVICTALLDNPFLRALDVDSNCLGAEGVASLARLLLSDCGARLEELSLHRNNGGCEGTSALAGALLGGGGGALRRLRLGNNHIGCHGAAALAQALAAGGGRALESLDVRRNAFGQAETAALLQARSSLVVLCGDGPV